MSKAEKKVAIDELTEAQDLNVKQDEDCQSKKDKFLSLNGITVLQMAELIEPSERYTQWLKVIVLRTMLNTKALSQLKADSSYYTTRIYTFLGFQNFEEFAKSRSLDVLREDLLVILKNWDEQVIGSPIFPTHLTNNLARLSEMAGLNAIEAQVLGLTILLHSESILQDCTEVLGTEMSAFSASNIFGAMLGLKTSDIEEVFEEQSNLTRSGLLTLDYSGEGNLRSRLDLVTYSFGKRAVMAQHDIRDLVKAYIKPVTDGSLQLDDFSHIQKRINAVKTYLSNAINTKQKGVNVLIYGQPGTGKTEFAKLISKAINCELMEITSTNLDGTPVPPIRRVRSYSLAQTLFRKIKAIVLFDECEEALSTETSEYSDEHVTKAQKSWINHTLENNALPAIWIANSIDHFDPAYIRRFDICFEMPIPDEVQRREMLSAMCGNELTTSLINEIAKNKSTSPALVAKTAKIIKTLVQDKGDVERNELALMLVNDKLRAQGSCEIKFKNTELIGSEFQLDMINAKVNLDSLCRGVASTREARMCIYGPPGTGKTAFGKWLADSLNMQHMVLKASDLLGAHVGETEQKIAQAFSVATRQKALLQFDEVDTFLLARAQAKQSWEISMVNEMLTQMESFDGVFIASTNLFENLDEAALRRFDMSLKFDFMLPEKAWAMFLSTCLLMNLPVNELELYAKFKEIQYLTPGDFQQVVRKSRLLQPASASDLLKSLAAAVSVKQVASSKKMGFLHAA